MHVVQKKMKRIVDDDLFSENSLVEEELFKDSHSTSFANVPPSQLQPTFEQSSSQSHEKIAKAKKRHKLPPAVRLERFNNLLSFIERRIGRRPEVETPLVRKRSWLTMMNLAANEDDLKRIVDIFPKYKESKAEFPDGFAVAFVRKLFVNLLTAVRKSRFYAGRCEELSCPQLSLTVFGNFAKYNLALTLPSARWLIHSLCRRNSISEIFLAASFYPVYNLPSISEDLPSAAMVAAACFDKKNEMEETIKVAEALLPHIQRMWKEEGSSLATAADLEEARMSSWVVSALKRLNGASRTEVAIPPEVLPQRIIIDSPSPVPYLNVPA